VGGLAKHAGTADTWTPVTDAVTAVQRVRHAPWTTSVIERAPGWLIISRLL